MLLLDSFLLAPGLLIATFFGAAVQRIAGMGLGIAISGFTLTSFDPFTAVYVSSIIGFGVIVITIIQLWRQIVWSAIWPIFLPMTLTLFLGFHLADVYGQDPLIHALFQTLGLVAILATLHSYVLRAKASASPLITRPWVGGSLAGFLAGTIGLPGPTIVPYFAGRHIVGTAFVATLTPIFIFASLARLSLGTNANFDDTTLSTTLLGAAIAIVGTYMGSLLGPYVSVKVQRWMIILVITASGGRLLIALSEGFWLYYQNASMMA